MARMVVTGAGPVGWTVAERLAEAGHEVTVVTRSGSGPERDGVRRVRADVSQPGALDALLDGAQALFHCVHGTAYAAETWRRELPATEQAVMDSAARAGAVVVFPESLYAYDATGVMTETDPRSATGGKRGVRADLLRARAAHAARTVSVVASDFYGPRVRMAHAGERMVPTILAGRTMWLLGDPDQPHSVTYVPDLAAAMVAALDLPARPDRVLHAPTGPALTQRELVAAFAAAGGVAPPRVRVVPGWVMRGLGRVHGASGELAEMLYQFERPFVMTSAVSKAELGLAPTPVAEACAATVAWWRGPGGGTSGAEGRRSRLTA